MPELKPLPAHLIGGSFLLAETDPGLTFTPDDLTSEQRLMAQTAGRFMEKEVLPNLEALEHQESGLAQKAFRKAGELALPGIEVPADYSRFLRGQVGRDCLGFLNSLLTPSLQVQPPSCDSAQIVRPVVVGP